MYIEVFPNLSTTMLPSINTMSYGLAHQGEAAHSIAKEISLLTGQVHAVQGSAQVLGPLR